MTILVDADACPVKDEIVQVARKHSVAVHFYADVNHRIRTDYGQVTIVDQGADSVDIALINGAAAGDIVITQDYGVGTLAIGRGCRVLHPSGNVLHEGNIDQLMFERHIAGRARRRGRRTGKIKKRKAQDNLLFMEQLERMIG